MTKPRPVNYDHLIWSDRPPVDMSTPVKCRSCMHVHDAGKVETVARYADCSCWRCPSCGLLLDDRPYRWGGTFQWRDGRWE